MLVAGMVIGLLPASLRAQAPATEPSVVPLNETPIVGPAMPFGGTLDGIREEDEAGSRARHALLGAAIGAVAGYLILGGTQTMNPGAAYV